MKFNTQTNHTSQKNDGKAVGTLRPTITNLLSTGFKHFIDQFQLYITIFSSKKISELT